MILEHDGDDERVAEDSKQEDEWIDNQQHVDMMTTCL